MNSIILQLSAKYIKPLLIVFSIFLLLRGHNDPGGGFIGGLLASAGILYYSFAYGASKARSSIYFNPKTFLIFGTVLVLISALLGFIQAKPLLTGLWLEIDIKITQIKLGSPTLFDTGIYFIVIGALLTITLSILEELEWK